MKFKWLLTATGQFALHLHGDTGKHSYIGFVLKEHAHRWHAFGLELDHTPALRDVEEGVYPTMREAVRALRRGFTVAWLGATAEEREGVWD